MDLHGSYLDAIPYLDTRQPLLEDSYFSEVPSPPALVKKPKVLLANTSLWEEFHGLEIEMITTSEGRYEMSYFASSFSLSKTCLL